MLWDDGRMRELLDVMPESSGRSCLLTDQIEHELIIQKSRFLTLLSPVATVEEADAILRDRRAEHPNATHHCTALALGTPLSLQRSNDDGEPGGTAGLPMAQALRGRDMTDILAIVTRYYGGVKLGAGGLVRAYSSAVTDGLDEAQQLDLLRERVVQEVTRTSVSYTIAGQFEAQVRLWAESPSAPPTAQVVQADYTADALIITLAHAPGLSEQVTAAMAELSAGAAETTTAGWTYADVPLSDAAPEAAAEAER